MAAGSLAWEDVRRKANFNSQTLLATGIPSGTQWQPPRPQERPHVTWAGCMLRLSWGPSFIFQEFHGDQDTEATEKSSTLWQGCPWEVSPHTLRCWHTQGVIWLLSTYQPQGIWGFASPPFSETDSTFHTCISRGTLQRDLIRSQLYAPGLLAPIKASQTHSKYCLETIPVSYG